jgi:hypothetical protein
MHELVPGLVHPTTFHDGIGLEVSRDHVHGRRPGFSYYVEPATALIDPRVPDEDGRGAFAGHARLQQVVLTSGLHALHAARFADAFGCLIRASPQALERLDGGLDAELYTHGEDVAPGITAIHIDAIAPDQYALHIAVDDRAIALADALNTYGGGWRSSPTICSAPIPRTSRAG